jgi:hypothetical protein
MPNATAIANEFVGRVFGRMVVVDVIQERVRALRLLCVCACGGETFAVPHQLRRGDKQSCGCLKKNVLGDAARKHGMANSRLTGYKNRAYGVWQAMHDRCTNANRKDYKYYGGKGVSVCARWHVFENFLADMGEPPKGLTLDRIDGNKGYSPINCRWATRKEQTYNSTNMCWIEHAGERMHLAAWLARTGTNRDTYYKRRKRGMCPKQALGLAKN